MSDHDILSSLPPVEQFTPEEEAVLHSYVTNTDRPVFALVNLPEVVKGALFARYSRSTKSLRRSLLDEFMKISPALPVYGKKATAVQMPYTTEYFTNMGTTQ